MADKAYAWCQDCQRWVPAEKMNYFDGRRVCQWCMEGTKSLKEYVYEPNVGVLLAELLPRYLNVQIYRGLLDNFASENAARMFAMNNATNNCDEMIGSLTLLFNKTRQTAITNELMDIVGGANALQS